MLVPQGIPDTTDPPPVAEPHSDRDLPFASSGSSSQPSAGEEGVSQSSSGEQSGSTPPSGGEDQAQSWKFYRFDFDMMRA